MVVVITLCRQVQKVADTQAVVVWLRGHRAAPFQPSWKVQGPGLWLWWEGGVAQADGPKWGPNGRTSGHRSAGKKKQGGHRVWKARRVWVKWIKTPDVASGRPRDTISGLGAGGGDLLFLLLVLWPFLTFECCFQEREPLFQLDNCPW